VYEIDTDIALFGLPEHRDRVQAQARQQGFSLQQLQSEPSRSAAAAAAASAAASEFAGPRNYAGPSVVVSRQESASRRSQLDLDRAFEDMEKNLAAIAPFDESVLATLRTKLYDHQRVGVSWMLHRELDPDNKNSGGLPSFWRRVKEGGKDVFINDITNCSVLVPPTPVSGGLLADDMGLGKSLSVVTCMLANPPAGVVYSVPIAPVAPVVSVAADGAEPAAAEVDPERAELQAMHVKNLQAECKKLGIAKTGNKDQLVDKIIATRIARAAPPAALGATGGAPAPALIPRGTLIVAPVS
jgi:hypothetical protein